MFKKTLYTDPNSSKRIVWIGEKMRRLVLGDVHGAYRALMQVFERSEFDYKKDALFVIGDIVDGWPETKQCIDELLKVENLTFILGNHDVWAWDWMEDGKAPHLWLSQGGYETVRSYGLPSYEEGKTPNVPEEHKQFFKNGHPFYETEDNKLFVHGGFDWKKPIQNQGLKILTWDRDLFLEAKKRHQNQDNHSFSNYDEIYIGHTDTSTFSLDPVNYCNIWNVDQGAGWNGRLTLMDIDTKEFWFSEQSRNLYTNQR